MSSRTALIVALVAALGALAYLLLGRGSAPEEPAPGAPTAAAQAVNPADSLRVRGTRSAEPDEPAGVVLRGDVRAAGEGEGTSIAGAVVTVTASGDGDGDGDAGEPRTVLTDADGRFEVVGLRPGRHAVSATATGYLPAVQRGLELRADASITLELASGGHPLRGTVSDATGGALEGALVRLTPLTGVVALRRLDGFGTLSAEDGTYAVHVAPGRYRVDVSHPDYATDTRTVEVGPGAQSQDFALIPMGVIEGVVRTADGRAVPRAWVSWQRERQRTIVPGHRMAMVEGSGLAQADEGGRFVVRGLAPGAIALRARAAGAASEVPTVVPLAMAEHVTDVVVRVAAAHDLRGRVVAKGEPERGIEGASVQLAAGERGGPRATTDAEGRFVLLGVLAGPHVLVASASGWHQPGPGVGVTAADDTPEVVLELEPAPMIRGRVEPPAVAEVSIELRPENLRVGIGLTGGRAIVMSGGAKTESDADGRFALDAIQPGSTTVVARTADGRAGETTVQVGPEGADEVVVRLEPRATVRGEVRSLRGEPVAQATVALRRVQPAGAPVVRLTINGRDMGADMGTTTEDGRFELAGVAAGDYEVQVSDRYGEPLPVSGGVEGRGRLTVAKGADVDGLVLTVDAHDGVIEGVVRTSDGEPVPDVWVRATLVPALEGPTPGPDEGGPRERSEMRMVVDSGEGMGAQDRPPVLTDDQGRFQLTGLRDADYELTAEADGGRQRVSVVARPGADAVLRLADLGALEGQVTLDGRPLESFTVRVEGPSSHAVDVRDASGRYALGRLDPGRYRVTVSTAEGSGRAEVTVDEGQTARQDVVLEHLAKVTGRIVDAQGQPVAGAVLMLGEGADGRVSIESDGEQEHDTTDEDGRFEVRCASGSRALLALLPPKPQPLVVHFFVVEPGRDVDLGELRERDVEGPGEEPGEEPGAP